MPSGHVIETLAGVDPLSPLATALAERAEILALSQGAHDAVLAPREPGGLSHGERAALAHRMALLGADMALAGHYARLLAGAGGSAALDAMADPARLPTEARQQALARHTDLVTREPRAATRHSIRALRDAGIAEPDIVRLSELVAFVNYQLRVIAGLRLMAGAA